MSPEELRDPVRFREWWKDQCAIVVGREHFPYELVDGIGRKLEAAIQELIQRFPIVTLPPLREDEVEPAGNWEKESRKRLGQALLNQANRFLANATKLQQKIECAESVLVITPVGARFVEVSRDVNLCDFTQAVAITRSSKHSE